MKILKQNELDEAAKILRQGKVLSFPTETVFGLGVIYDDKTAYDELVKVKRRPPSKPFTLMLADKEDVEKFAQLNKTSKIIVEKFMPGQITMIAKAQPGLPEWCVSNTGYIGIRIADYELVRNLIRKTGKPLLVPSANKSGENPALNVNQVLEAFDNEISAVVEGETVSNTPSTIVLIEKGHVNIVREGAITIGEIKRALSEE